MSVPPHPGPERGVVDPAKGVFETMLVAGGEPVELDAHMARLAASLRSLFEAEPSPGAREEVLSAARGVALGRLRLTVAPGAGGGLLHEIAVAEVDPASVFPGLEPGAPPRSAEQPGVALRSVAAPGWDGRHKWADRAGLERLEASLEGAAPLLLGEDGAVLETSRANLFTTSGSELRTPPLDGRILPGIARAQTIEIAVAIGIEVSERPLPLAGLLEAEEVFLTGSVRGIEPVGSLDGTALGPAGEPRAGDLTARLAAELRRRWLGVAP